MAKKPFNFMDMINKKKDAKGKPAVKAKAKVPAKKKPKGKK
jgi:hypothetical protein